MNPKKFNVFSLDDIQSRPIDRISSGYQYLDYQYGGKDNVYGLPCGGVTLFAGAAGVGKTRLWSQIARKMDEQNNIILYFQGEMALDRFKLLTRYSSPTFHTSKVTSLEEQLTYVEHLKPQLVIVDSVNTIREYRDGLGAKRIIEGDENERGYRSVLNRFGTHLVLLCQMNKEGKVKGRTELPHYCDIEFLAHKGIEDDGTDLVEACLPDTGFVAEVKNKNRFGLAGSKTYWKHHDWGIECFSVSDNVLPPGVEVETGITDKDWKDMELRLQAMQEVDAEIAFGVRKPRFLDRINKFFRY